MALSLQETVAFLNEWLTVALVIPGVCAVGCYLTITLRAIQIRRLTHSVRALTDQSRQTKGDISPIQAVSAVLAGNLGTGNISGVAIAFTTGGPGAILWMWIAAFLGAVVQYATCLLGTKYRRQNESGEFIGGPMNYLRYGIGSPRLGQLFCLFTIFGALTVGNLAQVHSAALPLMSFGVNPLWIGIVMACCVAPIVFGGIQRFARVVTTIVPFKAVMYLGCALTIIGMNLEKLPNALALIWNNAFSPEAALGGTVGFSIMKVMAVGFERGIFATDAGTGIAPILQASARTQSPVTTGIVSLLPPVVVMIVCTATALVLLVTDAWQSGLQSTNMVTFAFETGLKSPFGAYVVFLSLLLFSYTTIIAWAVCMDKAVESIFGKRGLPLVRGLFVMLIPIGTILHISTVWSLADICVSLMVIANLIAVIYLRKEVTHETRDYFQQVVEKPAFAPSEIPSPVQGI